MSNPDYKKIYDKYRLVCNNTVNGGDCRGETMCQCQLTDSELQMFYNKTRKNTPVLHEDYTCPKCNIEICGCCYDRCPSCKK